MIQDLRISLEYELKLVKVIQKLEVEVENIRLWIRSHKDKWYSIYLIYRDRLINYSNRIKTLKDYLINYKTNRNG